MQDHIIRILIALALAAAIEAFQSKGFWNFAMLFVGGLIGGYIAGAITHMRRSAK